MNLYDELMAPFLADPAAVAIIDVESGERFSGTDLDRLTAAARGALTVAGVGIGDRVLVQVEKSIANLVLYLACLRHGAVYVPLNTAYTAGELDYFVADAEPALVVLDPSGSRDSATALTLDADGRGTWADSLAAASPVGGTVERLADDLASICYTSGTTGRSKGAMLTHANLWSNAITLVHLWRFTSDDVLAHSLPTYHVHGLFVALHTAWLAGATVRLHRRFDVDSLLADLPSSTVYMGVPTNYTRLLAGDRLDRSTGENMRLFVSGSAPLLAATHDEFERRTGHRILERYGMTETGMITSNPYDPEGRVAGTVGYVLPGVDVRTNTDGVLEVRGANVSPGYWRRPDRLADDVTVDGWFVTGDLADIEPEGRVTLVGRAKDLIISGGLNVYPKEVEDLIEDIEGVIESAVIGVPHPDFGEAVVAVVVADPSTVTADAVKQHLAGRLARFKQPKAVVLVDQLPRNAMGKVQKNALRDRYRDLGAILVAQQPQARQERDGVNRSDAG